MDFLAPVTYTPSKGGVWGSLLSKPGPFDVQFKLNPKTPWKRIKYRITFWNDTDITWDEGSLHADWQAVGTNSAANASVVWSTPHSEGPWKRRITDISIWTVLKATEKLFHFHSETGASIAAWFWWHASDHNISGYIQSNHSHWYCNVSYTTEGTEWANSLLDHNIHVEGHGSVDGVTSDHAQVDVWMADKQTHRHLEINTTHHTFAWDVTAAWNPFSQLNIGMILPFPASSCKLIAYFKNNMFLPLTRVSCLQSHVMSLEITS